MIIAWRGLGHWVMWITGGALLTTYSAIGRWVDPFYFDTRSWVGRSLLLAAAACYPLGRYTRTRPGMRPDEADEEAGGVALDDGHHSLYFIPVHRWTPLLAVGGVVLCALVLVR